MTDAERHSANGKMYAKLKQAKADIARLRDELNEQGKMLAHFADVLTGNPEYCGISGESSFSAAVAPPHLQVVIDRKYLDADVLNKKTNELREAIAERDRLQSLISDL